MALPALWDLLVVPKLFFESRRIDDLTLPAIGAVALTVVATIGGVWVLGAIVGARWGPGYERMAGETLWIAVLVVPASVAVRWILVSGTVHLLVRDHVPSATFERTFALVAVVAVVEVPVVLLGVVDASLALGSAPLLDQPDVVLEAATPEPLLILAWTVVLLWEGYVWRQALRGAYALDRVQATHAAGAGVAVPIAAPILIGALLMVVL